LGHHLKHEHWQDIATKNADEISGKIPWVTGIGEFPTSSIKISY